MRPEYIRLQPAEKNFGEKNLLHAQLESISVLNHYEKYKELRDEELILKIALKNKLSELKETLTLFERLLPKPLLKPHKGPEQHNSNVKIPSQPKSRHTLGQEIEEMRRKLAKLH